MSEAASLLNGRTGVLTRAGTGGPDFHATHPAATASLLAVEPLPHVIWEPACGDGAICRELERHGKKVIASDLNDWGYATATHRLDFLMERSAPEGVSTIVTNPPYALAAEFITHAMTLVPKACFLMRLAFLEGQRWPRGLDRYLSRVWVSERRLPMMHRHGYEGPKLAASSIAFAWMTFETVHHGPPVLGWFDWRKHGGSQ
jgi:hypothetical protein